MEEKPKEEKDSLNIYVILSLISHGLEHMDPFFFFFIINKNNYNEKEIKKLITLTSRAINK